MEENNNEPEVFENNTQEKKTNGLAIAGFVVSLCSLLINLAGIVGLTGTILSAVGLAQAKTKNSGKGLAIAGLIIGIFSILYGIYTVITCTAAVNALL